MPAGAFQVELQRVIAVRINSRLCERLEAIARRENNYLSAVARRLLSDAIEREEARADTPPRSLKRGA